MSRPTKRPSGLEKVSQKEIAGRLGMHQSTVSYILAGKRLDRYSEETKRKVRELAAQLEYRPSRSARLLRGEGSRMIGVLEFDTRSAMARRSLRGVCDQIAKRGYTPLTLDANWFTFGSESVCDILFEQRVEGVVLVGFGDDFARKELVRLRESGIPLAVCMGLKVPGVFQVDVDRRAAFAELTRLALADGARHPCFLGRTVTTLRQVEKTAWDEASGGFKTAAVAAGIARPVIHMLTGPTERPTDFPASGRLGMEALMSRKQPPDAVICYNDLMAIGAMGICQKLGHRVPEDVGIYGFGEEEISSHLYPSLTTMKVREDLLAEQVVSHLFEAIETNTPLPDRQLVVGDAWEILPRASSCVGQPA